MRLKSYWSGQVHSYASIKDRTACGTRPLHQHCRARCIYRGAELEQQHACLLAAVVVTLQLAR